MAIGQDRDWSARFWRLGAVRGSGPLPVSRYYGL